jgi:acyl-CoA synthetase (AMP-forming)/AMP-acid ligase II
MQLTRAIRRAVQLRGASPATICGTRRRSWSEFADRVARFAAALLRLGLRTDSRVAILALNSDRYIECIYATWWAGCISVPLNVRSAPPELVQMLRDSGAEVLLVDDPVLQLAGQMGVSLSTFKQLAPELKHIISMGDAPPPGDILSYEELLAETAPIDDAMRDGDDVAGIYYTGGTTGEPKGVTLTHANMTINAITSLQRLVDGEDAIYLHAAPMFHLADIAMLVGISFSPGAHVVIPKFDPAEVLRVIREERVTVTLLVPTMLGMVLNEFNPAVHDLSSLKTITYGASPMPIAMIEHALRVMPDVGFTQAYGMTELAPVATALEAKHHALSGPYVSKLRSAGRAIQIADVKVADADDRELPRGTVGQILVRGPGVMKGYWNQPELTAETLRGGWMHTGDAGYMDDDGFLYVVDRIKDMIITGGENVYSAEVENAICKHTAVAMCAVVGIPHDKWGEQVHAILYLRPGQQLSEEDVITHCRTLIAGFKCPRSVEFRTEPLPISGAGKILKRQLRAAYWPATAASTAS